MSKDDLPFAKRGDATRRLIAQFKHRLTDTTDIERVADVLVDVGKGAFDKHTAIAWLRYSTDGQTLMRSLQHKEFEPMLTKQQALQVFAKKYGMVRIAKLIHDDPGVAESFTEPEFTSLMMDEATKHQRPGERLGTAFSRMFLDDSPQGLLLRQAHSIVKQAHFPSRLSLEPTQVGGKGATNINTDDSEAYKKLVTMAERLHAISPELTFAQAFAQVFTDPDNADLAEQERKQNRPRPTTNYPFPVEN